VGMPNLQAHQVLQRMHPIILYRVLLRHGDVVCGSDISLVFGDTIGQTLAPTNQGRFLSIWTRLENPHTCSNLESDQKRVRVIWTGRPRWQTQLCIHSINVEREK
jgi:hypothetical protein